MTRRMSPWVASRQRAHSSRSGGRTQLARVRAAGSVVGSDIRPFDVDAFDQCGFRDLLLGAPEILQGAQHVAGRSGDHGGKEARDAGLDQSLNGTRDFFHGDGGIVVVDAGIAVDLDIDEAGGEVTAAVASDPEVRWVRLW